jgi:aminopeptidase-like protein
MDEGSGGESGARRARMRSRMERLYPIPRSLTGDGVRETLRVLAESAPPQAPLSTVRVPSGTEVFDWTIGDEWNVREAYVADASGRHVVDFAEHNLHMVGYSVPVRTRLSLTDLRPHLHTLPDHPDWIPYRTSYYHRDWGFCLAQRTLDTLEDGEYDVVVDATLEPGELVYGELLVPGEGDEEVIVTSHVCHPSLANDNLTGLTVAMELAAWVAARPRRYSYRFVFAPGTIGVLTWLSRNPQTIPRIRHGLVLTGLGGGGRLVWKRTRHGRRPVDVAAAHVVRRLDGEVRPYSPYGYDERQFNAVGFDLPVGRLSRTPHGEYPEYHTSADDLDFVTDDELEESFGALTRIVDVLEGDAHYVNLSPYGEPQLGARGLYPTMGGRAASDAVMAMLWTLAYADGSTSLVEVADLADLDFEQVRRAADDLLGAGLLAPAES